MQSSSLPQFFFIEMLSLAKRSSCPNTGASDDRGCRKLTLEPRELRLHFTLKV